MKINHLCFTDDLLLFCKGEAIPSYLLLQGLRLFTDMSGLQANSSKSTFYSTAMDNDEVPRIEQFSGFKHENLPLRYLGVLINSKRLKASECDALVEKMTSRIRCWSTRHLSFAGIAQLINFVLLSRHYLWSGKALGEKAGHIKWTDVCDHKKVGGLGFRSIKEWNKAGIGKLVWHIGSKKDELWVKWVHAIYVKNNNWWDWQPPPGASRIIKHLCKIKNELDQKGMSQWNNQHNYSIKNVSLVE